MLSPNSIPSKRTGRALSNWSTDSGYTSGLLEDLEPGFSLGTPDCVSIRQSHPRTVGLGIRGLADLHLDNHVVIKKEKNDIKFGAPILQVCTRISHSSSLHSVSPTSPVEIRRSRAGKSTKLPSQAVGRLNAWLDANRHHPYPNAETKQALAEECGITVKQLTTWFTNTRQRQLKSQEQDLARVANNDAQHLNQSVTSRTSPQTSRKGKKKDYGRSNGASPIDDFLSPPQLSPSASVSENSSGETDNWQCTFCRKSLTAKSWRRHEETQHHPKHQWTCLATGPRLLLSPRSNISSVCAFCEMPDPDDSHFHQYHRIDECLQKHTEDRTFGRPDHLQQHARNFHRSQPLTDRVRDAWRSDGPGTVDNMSWICGFCHVLLPTWDARATHIAGHFKAGQTMADWQNTAGLMPSTSMEDKSDAYFSLDAMASMGVTIAGPSSSQVPHINYNYTNTANSFETQPRSTNAHMSPGPVQPNLSCDSLWADLYGNEVVASGPSEFTYDQITVPATVSYEVGMPISDDPFAGIDLYQDPVYYNGWDQQQ